MPQASFKASLRSLECFRAIMNTGSATAAAQQLGLTQPAVSRLLGLLERHIGFELFHRRKGRLIPTEEAMVLHKEADVALQSVDRVLQLARNLKNENFGELTIVSPPSFAEGILSRVIAEFIARHPNVQVSLDSQSVEKARDMVALRAVDCGFAKLPVDHPGLSCGSLIRAGTVCALPAGHRLARQQDHRRPGPRRRAADPARQGPRLARADVEEAFRDAGVE